MPFYILSFHVIFYVTEFHVSAFHATIFCHDISCHNFLLRHICDFLTLTNIMSGISCLFIFSHFMSHFMSRHSMSRLFMSRHFMSCGVTKILYFLLKIIIFIAILATQTHFSNVRIWGNMRRKENFGKHWFTKCRLEK